MRNYMYPLTTGIKIKKQLLVYSFIYNKKKKKYNGGDQSILTINSFQIAYSEIY